MLLRLKKVEEGLTDFGGCHENGKYFNLVHEQTRNEQLSEISDDL